MRKLKEIALIFHISLGCRQEGELDQPLPWPSRTIAMFLSSIPSMFVWDGHRVGVY